MAARNKVRPPFVWLGPYTTTISVILAVAIGAFFRFFQLSSLPPGLDTGTATIGLQALALLKHGTLPGFNAANGYAPLWVFLQAVAIQLFGHTALALRVWPALLGTLAVLTTWLWARSWFGLRIAWLSSFILAVTPWAVTVSRSGTESALWPFLVPLTLWLATRAWYVRSTLRNLLLVVVMILTLLCGPVGWLLVAATVAVGITMLHREKHLLDTHRSRVIALVTLLAGLAVLTYLLVASWSQIKGLPQASGLATSVPALGSAIVKALLMFNVNGDQSYQHNLAGQPLLNAFVGLMLIAGILVSISRLHERRYRLLFVFLIVLLIPALTTTVDAPNAARASAAMPLIMVLAAVGISYMLELWYKTFPINSAARATGQTAIIVLLGLTMFQGYSQYFQAWAGTSAVYTAFNEGAVQMSSYMSKSPKTQELNVVVSQPAEQPIVAYLDYGNTVYTPVAIANFAALPTNSVGHQFFITASARDAATKTLKAKFPGGVLYPHYSTFNQSEIYYTYVVNK